MKVMGKGWITAVAFTGLLLILISLAVADSFNLFSLTMTVFVLAAVGIFYRLFPGSFFFSIALTNFLGVYICIFVFFKQTNFTAVGEWPMLLGFALPIAAFLGGALLRREEVRLIVTAERIRDARHMAAVFEWLLPVFAIGALSFAVPALDLSLGAEVAVFLGAMAAIAVIVGLVSRDVSMFLLDTGILFEAFFRRMAELVAPAFAFFTFYSLIVIIFACVYRILDRFTEIDQFVVPAAQRAITFPEALYFSIITLSTVGYGEIVPATDLVRLIVSIQIMLGVLLLLFGFYEIMSYARERRHHRDE